MWRLERSDGRARRRMAWLGVISRSKIEHGVQSAVNANQRRYRANSKQSSVNVRASATPGVVTDCQLLIWHSEDDLGADHVTR